MKWRTPYRIFAFFSIFLPACFAETQPEFRDGKDYVSYKQPRINLFAQEGKLRLRSFFYYDCAACLTADDNLRRYAENNPDKVILERYPYFNEGKTFTARMYASFLEIGRPELSELYLFDSDGKKGNASLTNNESAIEHWLTRHGVEVKAFKQVFNSPKITQKIKEFIAISQEYGPPTAPFVSINGKYALFVNTLFNDDYTFAVLDFLYEKEQQEKK